MILGCWKQEKIRRWYEYERTIKFYIVAPGKIHWRHIENQVPPKGAQNGPAHYQSQNSDIYISDLSWGGGELFGCSTFDAESKLAKIQNSLCPVGVGGGSLESMFHLLMLSQNLLKYKICNTHLGGGGPRINVPTFDAEFKSAKIQNSLCLGPGEEGGLWSMFQLLNAEFKSAKTPNSPCLVGGGGCLGSMFQLFMLSQNLLKPQIRHVWWGGRWELFGINVPTFYAVQICKNPKFPMSDGRGKEAVQNQCFNFWCWVHIS